MLLGGKGEGVMKVVLLKKGGWGWCCLGGGG